jgi:hypothetical protein
MEHTRSRLARAALFAAPLFAALAGLSLVAMPVTAATRSPAGPAAERGDAALAAAEDRRFEAQIRRDVPALDAVLADELVYVHANGRRQSKADYLAGMRSAGPGYRSIVTRERVVHTAGDFGMTRALIDMVVGEMHLSSSYLAVYVRRAGRWQLLSWQTSPAPPAPAAATTPAPAQTPAH